MRTMENIIFILKYIGCLIAFFYFASLVGHLLKLDQYIKDHPNYTDKNIFK